MNLLDAFDDLDQLKPASFYEIGSVEFKRMISSTISSLTTESLAIQLQMNDNIFVDNEQITTNMESLRSQYVEIFNLQNMYYRDTPTWWIDVFRDSGDMMIANLKKDLKLSEKKYDLNWEVCIKHGTTIYKFNKDKRVVLIGRKMGCDILLPNKSITEPGTSRLHAIVYLLPEFGMNVIVDVGSLHGIKTLKRSSSKKCINSLPSDRKIITLDWEESADLRFYFVDMSINPKI